MSFFDSVLSFVEGMKSVIDVSGAIQSSISSSISEGIQSAFRGIRKPIEQSLMKISFIFVSLFFMVWGSALFVDNFVPYHGLGFVIVGAVVGIIALILFRENEAE